MVMILNEEQQLLKDSAKAFLSESAPISGLRAMRDAGEDRLPELWTKMSEMGWPGMVIPDAYSGLDFGYVGAGVVLEEMGRTLALSPFLSSAVVAATLINQLGSEQQKETYLPRIATGEITAVLAADETGFFDLADIATRATASDNGYILSGSKRGVIDGHNADLLLIVTDGDEGLSVFAVEPSASGVSCETRLIVDSQRAADISLETVSVGSDALLGTLGGASEALEFTIDVAAACSAAEMLGISIETFERTVGYLKEREQFGSKIGTFQGLQHRAAQLFAEIEVSKSAVLGALQALDANSEKRSVLASMAKAKCAKVVRDATEEGVQMHGGIGMTDEFDIGFFMKRAAVCRQAYGDYHFHADRFARLRGY